MKTSTAIIVVAAAAAGLWFLGKQQEAALAAQLAAQKGSAVDRVVAEVSSAVYAQTGNPFGATERCSKASQAAGTCDSDLAKQLFDIWLADQTQSTHHTCIKDDGTGLTDYGAGVGGAYGCRPDWLVLRGDIRGKHPQAYSLYLQMIADHKRQSIRQLATSTVQIAGLFTGGHA